MGHILVKNTTFGIRKTWMFSLLNISVTLRKLLSVSESQSTHLHNGNCCSISLESSDCEGDDHNCNDDGSLPRDFFPPLDQRVWAHLL